MFKSSFMQGLSDGFGQHEEPISPYHDLEEERANLADCRDILAAYVKRDEDNKQTLTLSMQRGWALEKENEYLRKKAAESDYLRQRLAESEATLAQVREIRDLYLRKGKQFKSDRNDLEFILRIDLKAARRAAMAATHPDRGGKTEDFQRVNAVFNRLEKG